uniref:NADH-ubiquinone oxidoreductase chain 6 n=1 Tax=Oxytelus sp. OXY01 TaxID=1205569 RepID=A0A0S2MQE8_9COLE|nr:NADH deshydrogenase subunit 6 [Oxytelus sp. OXY01]
MMIIMIMMINFSIMFIFMKHPISLGMILLFQTIMTALLMNSLLMNAWFSYIMLLVMIGGLLILFIYMTSLVSNEKFKFNPLILMMNFIYFILMSMLYFTEKFNLTMVINTNPMLIYNLPMNFNKFLMSNTMIMLMMIIYLLIVMIAVVKISNFKSGPLRQKF